MLQDLNLDIGRQGQALPVMLKCPLPSPHVSGEMAFPESWFKVFRIGPHAEMQRQLAHRCSFPGCPCRAHSNWSARPPDLLVHRIAQQLHLNFRKASDWAIEIV